MNKEQFIEYALCTPINSNRNVMDSMLEGIGEEEEKKELYNYLSRQKESVNPQVLKTWVDFVFRNFSKGVTYTLKINSAVSDPSDCCEYLDDATGMSKGSPDWDTKPIFNEIKPCIFKQGKVVYYLDPSDYSKKIDGTASVLDGTDGDVMVEFNKFAYRIYTEDNYTYISISNDAATIANDLRFKYLPFTRAVEGDMNKTYIGAYHGVVVDGKLRSVSGSMPTTQVSISDFRKAAQDNGEGYEQFTFYQLTMLQCLYLIRYGNLNGQAALGMGYVEASGPTNTGATNAQGMYYGDPENAQTQVKFAGLEDFYGNIANFVDGIYYSPECHIMTATVGFNDNATNYTDMGDIGLGEEFVVRMNSIQGNSELGFLPKTGIGEEEMNENSFNEYYSDAAELFAGGFAGFGAYFANGVFGGPFFLFLEVPADGAGSSFGARLSYYK